MSTTRVTPSEPPSPPPSPPTHVPRLPPLAPDVAAGRDPHWRLDQTQSRPCPSCSETAAEPVCVRPDRLLVARCACGFIYLPHVPSAADLKRFYDGYNQFKGYRARDGRVERFFRAQLARRDARVRILELTGGLRGRRVVEIGASVGAFLELLRARGADVSAVEIDEEARRVLESRGLSAAASFDANARPDIVCAFNLLEHLVDPRQVVAQVADALPPDGRFFVQVPNATEARALGPYWVGYRVDLEHLNFFDLSTLTALLAQHGLWVEQYWTTSQPHVFRSQPSLGARTARKVLERAAELTLAPWLPSVYQGAFQLTVLARKAA